MSLASYYSTDFTKRTGLTNREVSHYRHLTANQVTFIFIKTIKFIVQYSALFLFLLPHREMIDGILVCFS